MDKKKILKKIVCVVFVIFIILSLCEQGRLLKDEKEIKEISQEFIIEQIEEDSQISQENNNETQITQNKPFVINWETLKNTNPDIIAWIRIPNTNINYPIVKGKNNDTYLRKNIYGKKSVYGSIFVEEQNDKPFENFNTIIYGHNFGNKLMFSDLRKYKNSNYYQNHKEIYIYLPNNQSLVYQVVSFHTVDKADKNVFSLNNTTYEDYEPYINENNILINNIDSFEKEKVTGVLTLSTCTNSNKNTRYVLHAVRTD